MMLISLLLLSLLLSNVSAVRKKLNITLYRVEAKDQTPNDIFGSNCDYFGNCDLQIIFCIRQHYENRVQAQNAPCEGYKRVELTQDNNFWSGILIVEVDVDDHNEHKYLQYNIEDSDLIFSDNIFSGSVTIGDLDHMKGVRKFVNNSHISMRLILRDL